MNSRDRIRRLTKLEHVLDYWPSLLEGFQTTKGRYPEGLQAVSTEGFFKTVCNAATSKGILLAMPGKAGKLLGFVVGLDATVAGQERAIEIFTLYSTGQRPSAVVELRYELERYARVEGYKVLRAAAYRLRPPNSLLCGSMRRYFVRLLKLKPKFLVFETAL